MSDVGIPGPLGMFSVFSRFDKGNMVCVQSSRPGPEGIMAEGHARFLELEKGNFDDKAVVNYATRSADGTGYVRGTPVFTLQKDLALLGFGAVSDADGDFGKKTVEQVKSFQVMAKNEYRMQSGSLITVGNTFKGQVNGRFDKATWKELQIWLAKGYRIPLMTFPGTSFRYLPTKLTVAECIATLPSQLRPDFKEKIVTVIRAMHKLGFAFGVWEKPKAGYRTFRQQNDIDPSKTNAGPGESFHNYGSAVDLGVLQWVDSSGKVHDRDFWLGGMDAMKQYKGFSAKVWARRNAECPGGVYSLSFETIHLQSVPANSSGRSMLVNCLNQAAKDSGDSLWRYRKASHKQYQCNMGDAENWKTVGTAKQMFSGMATNVTNDQKKKIKMHMEKAESVALTIALR